MEQQQLLNSEIRRAETRVSAHERVPVALRLGDHSNSPTSQARIPASQRLGPVMDAEPSKAGEVPMKLNNEEARMGTKQTKELTRGEASRPAGFGGNSQSSDNIPFSKKIPRVWGIPGQFDVSKKYRPDIFFLIETKNPNDFMLQKVAQLGYEEHNLVAPTGHGAGGLALLWKQEVKLTVIYSDANVLETMIEHEGKKILR
ncbi:unnamed protein product [Brassica oleracea]